MFGLNVENIWHTDECTLRREASKKFMHLFPFNDPCNPHSTKLENIPSVGVNLHNQLLLPVTEKEVKDVIFYMHSYKALVPDGFQPIFFKTSWHIVGDDVWKMVSDAFASSRIGPTLAKTLIVPIPKIDTPLSFTYFPIRPFFCLMQCAFEDYFQSTS